MLSKISPDMPLTTTGYYILIPASPQNNLRDERQYYPEGCCSTTV